MIEAIAPLDTIDKAKIWSGPNCDPNSIATPWPNATYHFRPIPAGGGRPLSGKLVLKSRATKSRSFPMDFFECQIPAALLAQDAHVL